MENNLLFEKREDFRTWLTENATTSGGVWLVFGKTKQVKSLKAGEALEEALCFGWIDGVMKKVDEHSYLKYFATRRKNSKWSEKNKKVVDKLEQQGLMTDLGRENKLTILFGKLASSLHLYSNSEPINSQYTDQLSTQRSQAR